MNIVVNDCYREYSALNQEKGSYDFNWQAINTQNSTFDYVQNAFKYTQSSQIDSYPYMAKVNTYFGGGYVFKMIGNASFLTDSLVMLQEKEWIDKQTAAVFVEFTLYNPNINLYQYCSIVFEILQSGNFVNSALFYPLDLNSNDLISAKYLLGIAYLLCIVILMAIECKQLYKLRLQYFKQFYNYIDILIIAFSWSSFSMFLYRLYASFSIYTLLSKKGLRNKFINLQYIASYDQNMTYFFAACAAFVTLRFIKVLRFNKRIILFLEAFKRSLKDLFSFGIVFLVVFMSFVQAIYFLMNSETYEFSSIHKAMETCFQIILGKFNANAFLLSKSFLAPFLFSIYNVVMLFLMINIFVTILMEHYNLTREDESLNIHDPHLFSYLISKVRTLMFWRKDNKKEDETKVHVYIDVIESLPSRFDDIVARLNKVSHIYNSFNFLIF